jgi:hypothetical protein
MTINTINKKEFELLNENSITAARLTYSNSSFTDGLIEAEGSYSLNGIETGTWVTYLENESAVKLKSKIKVETGGVISLRLVGKKKKYYFKKTSGWKLRFSLSNKDGEDLLSIIPKVNWPKESHDFILQLNEEFEKECDSFLILQAVHCANCSLSMMTGGKVPALVSI